MSSRMSKGCLRCRTRRVKCDEGRPSCRRCIQRDEICTGYRDEASLIFRDESENISRRSIRRRASTQNFLTSNNSSQATNMSRANKGREDPSDLSAMEVAGLSLFDLYKPYPWAKAVPEASAASFEDQAVSQFFERYVMYPSNDGSSPGFLEYLPVLFEEVNVERRLALRWAVRAAAYANLSSDHSLGALKSKALHCYGLALSALAESLADTRTSPDDYILMTVVVLDLFEAMYLHDSVSAGSHAQGMAQILRLRGPNQIYGARGWSLFRLSHHRLQKQQLAFKLGPLPESEDWLDSLNEELPDVRLERDNFQINEICERARNLRKYINQTDLPIERTIEIVKEMHTLDRTTTTWRDNPKWAYKTIPRSDITQDTQIASRFPEYIQLHHDVWIAYEWNYHRTARIILHEHLLECLDRLENLSSVGQKTFQTDLDSLKQASIAIVQGLVDDVLSTVPQSLGDVDHEGNLLEEAARTQKCKGVGGYFLLWPIKISKRTHSATRQQRFAAQCIFERIRECTGMKSAFGDLSSI